MKNFIVANALLILCLPAACRAQQEYPIQVKIFALRNLVAKDAERVVKPFVDLGAHGVILADERTNSLIVRGIPPHLAEIEALLLKLDQPVKDPVAGRSVPGSMSTPSTPRMDLASLADRQAKYSTANQQSVAMARRARQLQAKPNLDPAERDRLSSLVAALQTAVRDAFAARQQLQRGELAALRQRMRHIETSIHARDRLQHEIIQRRVQELLNPNLRWDESAEPTQAGNNKPGAGRISQVDQPGNIASQRKEESDRDQQKSANLLQPALIRQRISEKPKEMAKEWQRQYERQAKVFAWPQELMTGPFSAAVEKLTPIEEFTGDLMVDYREAYLTYLRQQVPNMARIIRAKWTGGGEKLASSDGSPAFIMDWNQDNQKLIARRLTKFSAEIPTTKEMLYANEDLGVITSLLRIIKVTNEKGDDKKTTNIKQLHHLLIGPDAIAASRVDSANNNSAGERNRGQNVPAEGRYVDKHDRPLPAAALKNQRISKRLPVRIGLAITPSSLPDLLANCSKAALPMEIKRVQINAPPFDKDGDRKSGEDASGDAAAIAEEANTSEEPSYLSVVIHGVIHIYYPVESVALDAQDVSQGTGPSVVTSHSSDRIQIHISEPEGAKLSWPSLTPTRSPLIIPGRFHVSPSVKRESFVLADVPGREGLSLYGSVEFSKPNSRASTYLAHNAIPIVITEDDIVHAVLGTLVTKVVYLPDAKFAERAVAGIETMVTTRLDPGVDAVVEADRRGQILCILRLGNREPDKAKPKADETRADSAAIPFAGDEEYSTAIKQIRAMIQKSLKGTTKDGNRLEATREWIGDVQESLRHEIALEERKIQQADPSDVKLQNENRNKVLKLKMLHSLFFEETAALYPKGSESWTAALRDAANAHNAVYLRHRPALAGVAARFHQARCLQLAGDEDKAKEIFNELLTLRNDSDVFKRIKTDSRNRLEEASADRGDESKNDP